MKKKRRKLFNNDKITKKELRKLICVLAFSRGVNKIRFSKRAKYISGSYNYDNANIFVDGKQPRKNMLMTFFHELAHHEASSKKKWLLYHQDASTPRVSPNMKFKIENKIDKLAQKLWFRYVDVKVWGRYKFGYLKSQKKYIIEWLDTYY
jgi:hypothetical protein